jgi:hypothetical protein
VSVYVVEARQRKVAGRAMVQETGIPTGPMAAWLEIPPSFSIYNTVRGSEQISS